jgi:uncharacterized protein (DUF433 family)
MIDQPYPTDLSEYVETRFFGERPHIRGRRIPIWVIVHTAEDNQHRVRELMHDFDLNEAEVLAALLYYSEHKADIEAQEEAVRQEYKHFYDD